MTTAPGSAYRVKAEHPGRPGSPLRVTDRSGRLIASSGDLCTDVAPEFLASMIRKGWVELVEPVAAPPKARKARDTEGEA